MYGVRRPMRIALSGRIRTEADNSFVKETNIAWISVEFLGY